MKNLKQQTALMASIFVLICGVALGQAKPPAKPADLRITVAPEAVAAGGAAEVTLRIEPIEGVKINRYPKIKLEVPALSGLVEKGYAEIGNATPPPPDKMETNYYKVVDPVKMTLKLDAAAKPGKHEIDAKLTYFYCVAASGFCAPAHVPIKIPVAVR